MQNTNLKVHKNYIHTLDVLHCVPFVTFAWSCIYEGRTLDLPPCSNYTLQVPFILVQFNPFSIMFS